MHEVQAFVQNPSIMQAVKKVFEENEELTRQMEQYRKEHINTMVEKLAHEMEEEDGMVLYARQINMPVDVIKDVAFALRQRISKLVLIIGSSVDGKVTLSVMLGNDIVAQGVNASQIVREAAKEINGGGGGQPFFATAGGKSPENLEKAIIKAKDLIKEQMNK